MRKRSIVLAFDLGASSGRALVGELDYGKDERSKLQITEVHRFPNQAIQVGNHIHWDILRLLQEVKNGIRKAYQAGYTSDTFGIDTWGVDFGLIDANGELLGNPYHYRDSQTEGLVGEWVGKIGKMELFEQTGLQNMPFNTLYQLYAMKKAASPKLEAAQNLMMISDLLVYMLTGQKVCEFTMATTTQLFHPVHKAWNKTLLKRLGIPVSLFLEPIQPGVFIGPLTKAVCEELNVPPINAVAVATHDTASAIAAVPAGDKPFMFLVCGTWSLLGTELSEPILTLEAMELDFSNEGGVGNTYQLLKNIMGLWIVQECKREWDEQGRVTSYSELVSKAEKATAFRSLINPDDLRFYTPSGMVEKIQSFCRETEQAVPNTEGEIIRCILESLALRYRHTVVQLEKLTNRNFGELYIVGGGVQNELLCQFTANALGRPVWAGPVEASAIGNMLIQLIALGHCTTLQEARELVSTSFPVTIYEAHDISSWNTAYEAFQLLI